MASEAPAQQTQKKKADVFIPLLDALFGGAVSRIKFRADNPEMAAEQARKRKE